MGYYHVLHSAEVKIENCFEALGRFIVNRTALVFILTLIFSLGCGAGLMNMESVGAIDKLWVPLESQAKVSS